MTDLPPTFASNSCDSSTSPTRGSARPSPTSSGASTESPGLTLTRRWAVLREGLRALLARDAIAALELSECPKCGNGAVEVLRRGFWTCSDSRCAVSGDVEGLLRAELAWRYGSVSLAVLVQGAEELLEICRAPKPTGERTDDRLQQPR